MRLLAQLRCQLAGFVAVRLGAVDQNDIGLADLVQLGKNALLRLAVGFARQIGNRAVGGHNNAHRGVFADDPPGAGFGGKVKGNLLVKPRAFDQTRGFVFLVAQSPLHHIAHAVDQPCAEFHPVRKLHRHGFFGDEFRLGGHNGAPGGRLGQFVLRAGAAGFVLDMRQQHKLRKALDKAAFAGAHRTDDPQIDIPACALGDILVELFLCHRPFLLYSAAGISNTAVWAVSSCGAVSAQSISFACAKSLARAW